jgi:hypothetical protein
MVYHKNKNIGAQEFYLQLLTVWEVIYVQMQLLASLSMTELLDILSRVIIVIRAVIL